MEQEVGSGLEERGKAEGTSIPELRGVVTARWSAERLGISVSLVYRLVREGRLEKCDGGLRRESVEGFKRGRPGRPRKVRVRRPLGILEAIRGGGYDL